MSYASKADREFAEERRRKREEHAVERASKVYAILKDAAERNLP